MTPELVRSTLAQHGYLTDKGLATSVSLAYSLKRPLLLEGEPGVGKTELAKAIAAAQSAELIRLQCYDGIDAAQAVYDWDYARQLLYLRASEATGTSQQQSADQLERALFQERFLIKRAILRAIEPPPEGSSAPVLLIDEIDRADDEFEAYLLEVLSDFQVTVPELGTFTAATPPTVILTSNRTRDVHDALKRRCLYHWVEHPSLEREVEIIRMKVPSADEHLAAQVAKAVEALRGLHLYKPPGVAETIDWALALGALGVAQLDEQTISDTIGTVIKYREDQQRVAEHGFAQLMQAAMGRGNA